MTMLNLITMASFVLEGLIKSMKKIYEGKSIVLEHDNPNQYPCSKTGSPKKYSTYNLSKIGVLKVKIEV
jgi:hypothetical protein